MLFIYRNLHRTHVFSIRERGRVVDRLVDFVAHDVRFKVNELGRLRVIRERQKNVHAFVVAQRVSKGSFELGSLVTYNPYSADTFMCDGEPIHVADAVIFTNGKCYLAKSNSSL